MHGELLLPRFDFRPDQPSLWTMFTTGIGNVSAVIPEAILEDWAVPLTGPGAPLVVSSPELARLVLNDRADHFVRDRLMARVFRRSWGRGLAAAEGDNWQRQRRAVVPFFTPRAVSNHLAAFAAAVDDVIGSLSIGEELDLTDLAGRIVARIVLSVLVDGRGLVDPDAAARDVPGYVRALTGFTLADLLPLPEGVIDRLHGIDSNPSVRSIRAMADQVSARRSRDQVRTDMIALLDGVGPVTDNVRGLFPAAMDTTVAGLAFTLYALAKSPSWQERVAAEGASLGDQPAFASLGATRQVVMEALRMFPPAPLLVRAAGHAMDLGGHHVRKGQTVIVAIYAMHRHRRLWDDPDLFDPDRFGCGRGTSDAYMPFGTGPRMCVAAHFVQAEIAVIAARLLTRLRLSASPGKPVLSLQVTTRAVDGLKAKVERRAGITA